MAINDKIWFEDLEVRGVRDWDLPCEGKLIFCRLDRGRRIYRFIPGPGTGTVLKMRFPFALEHEACWVFDSGWCLNDTEKETWDLLLIKR